jgi:IclR family acetate operon transcriptional repressor
MSPALPSQQSAQNVRALERAARIVTTLAEHPYDMGILELAERIQLSQASVHRLLSTLVNLGWVEQNSRTSRYRLGIRMVGVGTTGLVTNPAVNEGMSFLARLSEVTGHDALLSTLIGLRTVNLARVAGRDTPSPDFRPELRADRLGRAAVPQPAHATADGKMLLSYLPAEQRMYLYEVQGLPAYTPNTITDVQELERELERTQERGYAIDDAERFEHSRGVAVPIQGPDRLPMLAMLCVGAVDPVPDWHEPLARYLMPLAREMAERLTVIGDMPGADAPPPATGNGRRGRRPSRSLSPD